jgi:predicted HTH transcriptional regulator
VSDADKLIADIWNAANNPQRVSANELFNHQVYKVKCGSKAVVVVEVPRAERTERPVYVGRDLFRGTFRRNGEGDCHCSQEAVEAMIRDKCPETADNCLLEDMTIADLNQESIARYRLMLSQSKPEHAWARIPDDEFLVKIGAAKKDSKGVVRPMLAGLICFGDFVTISNVLPNYFLDYRECLADGSRWTDRVAAHDATWSGNIIDFYFRIYDKVTSSVKVPFRLNDRGLRVNETKVHKALRELLANALIHADYHGRQGIVIEKRYSKLMFRNPACLRMAKEAAIGGGRSDARNSRIFNIFALINIGERSGTGLSDIFSIWKEYGYEQPSITETYQPDQTTVTVQVELEEITATTQENAVTTQEVAPKGTEVAPKIAPKTNGVAPKVALKTSDVAPKGDEVAPKNAVKNAVKPSGDAVKNAVKEFDARLRENIIEKCAELYCFLRVDPRRTILTVVESLGFSPRSVAQYLNVLKDAHVLEHVGPTHGGTWKFLI